VKAGNNNKYVSSIEKKREALDMLITIMNGKESEKVMDKMLKILRNDLDKACEYF